MKEFGSLDRSHERPGDRNFGANTAQPKLISSTDPDFDADGFNLRTLFVGACFTAVFAIMVANSFNSASEDENELHFGLLPDDRVALDINGTMSHVFNFATGNVELITWQDGERLTTTVPFDSTPELLELSVQARKEGCEIARNTAQHGLEFMTSITRHDAVGILHRLQCD